MKNEILDSLRRRKSLRVFAEREVEGEKKNCILEAAAQAPTAGCQQLYTILDITDQAVKERLAVLCDSQEFIARAPIVLVFLADCRRWLDAYHIAGANARKPGVGDLMLAVSDAVIAAQNTVVAAEALGLGSCYIGDVYENEEQMRELLGLDDYVFPATMVVYGYPAPSQLERKKPQRFQREYIVMENCYRRLSQEEHRAMFEKRGTGGKDFEGYLTAFCNRKYESEFSREMTRSVGEYLKRFQ